MVTEVLEPSEDRKQDTQEKRYHKNEEEALTGGTEREETRVIVKEYYVFEPRTIIHRRFLYMSSNDTLHDRSRLPRFSSKSIFGEISPKNGFVWFSVRIREGSVAFHEYDS